MPTAFPTRRRLAWLLLPVVVAGFAALWTLAALYSGHQCSWMAVIGAIDVLWVLGLSGRRPPLRTAAVAVLATAALIALANWSVAAAQVGGMVGLDPLASMTRLGARHGWVLLGIANRWQDGVWLALALALAAGGPFLSARLRAPSAR
ncbi:hypothetical protein [Lysobacter humi (ex Lee et al. 2017)]